MVISLKATAKKTAEGNFYEILHYVDVIYIINQKLLIFLSLTLMKEYTYNAK